MYDLLLENDNPLILVVAKLKAVESWVEKEEEEEEEEVEEEKRGREGIGGEKE